jgi:hypothetical protein
MKKLHIVLGLAVAGVLAGCVTKTPDLDRTFGDAVREARMAQTLNPDASKNTDPVLGIDGRAAREGYLQYQDSFKEPVQAPDVSVGNSTGGTGGGTSGGGSRR